VSGETSGEDYAHYKTMPMIELAEVVGALEPDCWNSTGREVIKDVYEPLPPCGECAPCQFVKRLKEAFRE
jgi:hypothetical protein